MSRNGGGYNIPFVKFLKCSLTAAAAFLLSASVVPALAERIEVRDAVIVYDHGNKPGDPTNCSAAGFVQWPDVPGEEVISVGWTFDGSPATKATSAPDYNDRFQYVKLYEAPAGFHRAQITKGARDSFKPVDCADLMATLMGLSGTQATITVKIYEGSTISGKVRYRTGSSDGVPGITIRLTGTEKSGAAVDKTVKTDEAGYVFDRLKPGSYTVEASGEGVYVDKSDLKDENGGVLSVFTADGGSCGGSTLSKTKCRFTLPDGVSVKSDFSYTLCAADGRMPNDKPLTHCPIVLVPGFLGSRIGCNGTELWPGVLPGQLFGSMLLEYDGITNQKDLSGCNQFAEAIPGEPGVVDAVAGADIYKGALDFLKKEAPERWRAAPYDWRKAPTFGAQILEATVNEVLETTKSKYVVLFGHSMGGLVIREYLNKQSNADKVARIMTAGTPYWGAPKSHFALLGGYTDTPSGSPLDLLVFSDDLQMLARNLQGLFFLYPSANLGAWLSVSPRSGMPLVLQQPSGEVEWVATLGANPALLANARRWHDANDGFPQTDIDYRAVVGAGTGTTIETKVRVTGSPDDSVYGDIVIGNGDGTVPLRSATQGASDGGPPLGKNVPIYYACGVGHVDLPVNALVLAGIRPFLLGGEEVIGLKTNCPYSGTQLLLYDLDLGGGNEITVDPEGFQQRVLGAAGAATGSLSLNDAVGQGIVQFMRVGNSTIILTDDAKPVTITINGKSVVLQTKKFGSDGDGKLLSYEPVKGSVSINTLSDSITTRSNKKLTPISGNGKAPKTTARITRNGKKVSVKLSAKATVGGVSATYYQIGTGAVTRYKKSFKVKTGKKPVKVGFYSINAYGVTERLKKITVR